MKTYQEKIAELEHELRQITLARATAPPERQAQLTARAASVRRSLRWYSTRLPRRIGVLSVGVHDHITSEERVG